MVDTPAIPPSNPGGAPQPEKKEQLQVPPIKWKGQVFWDSDDARKFWYLLSQSINKDVQKNAKKTKKAMKFAAGQSDDPNEDS